MKSLIILLIAACLTLQASAQQSIKLTEDNIERPGRAMLWMSGATFLFATSFAVQNTMQKKNDGTFMRPLNTMMGLSFAMMITASIQINRDNERRQPRIIQ